MCGFVCYKQAALQWLALPASVTAAEHNRPVNMSRHTETELLSSLLSTLEQQLCQRAALASERINTSALSTSVSNTNAVDAPPVS